MLLEAGVAAGVLLEAGDAAGSATAMHPPRPNPVPSKPSLHLQSMNGSDAISEQVACGLHGESALAQVTGVHSVVGLPSWYAKQVQIGWPELLEQFVFVPHGYGSIMQGSGTRKNISNVSNDYFTSIWCLR